MLNTALDTVWTWLSGHFNYLVLFGFVGQGLFMMRFLAQLWHSEKQGRSAVPEIFWIFSILGGAITLVYAIFKNDIVFMIAQAAGLFVYARNMILIGKAKAKHQSSNSLDILQALSVRANALLAKGEELTENETKAAAEALHILETHKK